MKRILLISLGSLALAMGGIGLFLPIWPTTPFVLCAAGCFAGSSPALYRRLEATRYFGEYIRNYRDKTGISARARWTGFAFLWGMLILSACVFRSVHVWITLGVVGAAVSVHILTIRRKKAEPASNTLEAGE